MPGQGRASGGLSGAPDSSFDRTRSVVSSFIETGLYPGAQIYVSHRGRTVVDDAVGVRAEGEPLDRRDALPLLSVSKCFLATAAALLWERGRLDLESPIATYVDGYGQNGKEAATMRHLLTHSVGPVGEPLLHEVEGLGTVAQEGHAATLARACAARLAPGDGPGTRSAYSQTWSWVVLAEALRRIDGRHHTDLVRDEVLEPVGADLVYGRPGPGAGAIFERRGGPPDLVVHRPITEGAALPSPGAGLWGCAAEAAKLFELLRAGGRTAAGAQVLSEATVLAMTTPQRPSMFDNRPIVDVGLGLMIEGRRHGLRYAYFGTDCSDRTAGHYGLRSSLVYADLEHGLVVSLLANGYPDILPRQLAWRRLSRAVYEDAGVSASRADAPRRRAPAGASTTTGRTDA